MGSSSSWSYLKPISSPKGQTPRELTCTDLDTKCRRTNHSTCVCVTRLRRLSSLDSVVWDYQARGAQPVISQGLHWRSGVGYSTLTASASLWPTDKCQSWVCSLFMTVVLELVHTSKTQYISGSDYKRRSLVETRLNILEIHVKAVNAT